MDNLSGARVAGRQITVNHVDNYKIKRAEVRLSLAIGGKRSLSNIIAHSSALLYHRLACIILTVQSVAGSVDKTVL